MRATAFRVSLISLAASALSVPAAAATLSTPIDNNNGQRGLMFDVVVGASNLTLTSLATTITPVGEAAIGDYRFYTRTGSIVGNTDSLVGWTLRDSFSGVAGGATRFDLTTFDIADFTLLANSTYGFYLTSTSGTSIQYTGTGSGSFGTVRASNGDLSILSGVGKDDTLGFTFSPRSFNGTLTYTGGVVPEPASWALMIGGFGLVGASMRRRRASFTAA
jgi:hypothetical protein